ncbi:MAG: hypothetical protein JWN28_197 [Candidatus Saccharibacteria bacterium]|nr:hypothetical protein [Candidatus Saccharibacteria bacterium]
MKSPPACYNMGMFLVGILSWWYGRGWLGQWRRMSDRWRATVQFFSIGQLLATLFSPFRQISANTGNNANPMVALRAVFDQLVSRVVGAFVRSFTILAGSVVIAIQVVYESLLLVLWAFLPLLPIIGFILFAIGWVPTWM